MRDFSRPDARRVPQARTRVRSVADRPEGYTDGHKLIPGWPHEHFVPGTFPPGVTARRPAI